MKKNIREDKRFGVQFAYVLDSICVEDEQGNDLENVSDEEKVSYVFKRFEKEYNYLNNKIRYPNEQERIKNWLMGLPSCVNIAFMNYDIEQLGKQWGFCQTEKKAALFAERWFNTVALRLLQLRARLCK